MRAYLLELYVPRSDADAVEDGAERARRAAEELTAEGTPVRYIRSVFVPEDETCFCLYEAAAIEDVRAAAERAGLPDGRIAEAVTAPTAPTATHEKERARRS